MKMSAKKVLGLVLAGVLAAGSLTACGGGGTAATTADTKAETTTAASDAKAESDAAADTTAADSGEKKTLRVAMECAHTHRTTGPSRMIPTARLPLRTAMNLLTDMMS